MLRCAMFRRAASLLDFNPADGQQVEVRGRLAVYESRGELQLVVESLQRLGAGTLYEEFLRRRARLEAAGALGILQSNWSGDYGVNKVFSANTDSISSRKAVTSMI